jgi:hypothetical protein
MMTHNELQQADALEDYLNKLNAHPNNAHSGDLDPRTAVFAQQIMRAPEPLNRQMQTRIWAQVRTQSQSARQVNTWTMGIALACATVIVAVLLVHPTRSPEIVAAPPTSTPTVTSQQTHVTSAETVYPFQGMITYKSDAVVTKRYFWVYSPDQYRIEDYGNSMPTDSTLPTLAAYATLPDPGSLFHLWTINARTVQNNHTYQWVYDAVNNNIAAPEYGATWANMLGTVLWNVSGTGWTGLQNLLAMVKSTAMDAQLLTTETIAGRPCWVIEVSPRHKSQNSQFQSIKQKLWIDQETHLQLKFENYATDPETPNIIIEFNHFEPGTPSDATFYQIKLPASAWRNPPTNIPFDHLSLPWHRAALQVPFSVYSPSADQLNKVSIITENLIYDPFKPSLSVDGYSASDPYGAAHFKLMETTLENAHVGSDAHAVPELGDVWQDSSGLYLGMKQGSAWIQIQSDTLSESDLVALGKSLRYATPFYSLDEMDGAWRVVANLFQVPTYQIKATDPANAKSAGVYSVYDIFHDGIVPELPHVELNKVTQNWYYAAKPGIVAVLTETPLLSGTRVDDSKLMQLGSFKGYYEFLPNGHEHIVVYTGTTLIEIDAQPDLDQQSLIALASSLTLVIPNQ